MERLLRFRCNICKEYFWQKFEVGGQAGYPEKGAQIEIECLANPDHTSATYCGNALEEEQD